MKQASMLFGALISATMLSQPANAGLSDWINNYFTFREDQKPLVAPQNVLPPKHVITPNYNGVEAKKWTNYYSRKDLAPVNNFDSSSMVMRPRDESIARLEAKRALNQTPYEKSLADARNNPAYAPKALSMYEQMERRDYANRIKADNKIYIGEPGMTPGQQKAKSGDARAKTAISNPVYGWNEKGKTNYANPRVGDYDYARDYSFGAKPWQETRVERMEPGQTVQASGNRGGESLSGNPYGTSIQAPTGAGSTSNNALNGFDKPNRYTVEPEDSLSGISNKDKIYGDWKLWPLIYDANKSQIQDPDLIHPGQDLGIPRDYTNQNASDARGRAIQKKPPYSFYDNK